jgi:hypothetical protein
MVRLSWTVNDSSIGPHFLRGQKVKIRGSPATAPDCTSSREYLPTLVQLNEPE